MLLPRESKMAERRKKSILVVDDDDQFNEMMRATLTRLGYNAITCGSPHDALQLLSKAPELFDAAIVDAIMPEMKGTELAIEFLRIKDDMPVILVTGYGNLIPMEWVGAAGIRVALTKPVLREEIKEALSNALVKTDRPVS